MIVTVEATGMADFGHKFHKFCETHSIPDPAVFASFGKSALVFSSTTWVVLEKTKFLVLGG